MRSRRSPSERLLRRVRNRLWGRELLDLVTRAGWASAGLLVAAGILHLTVRGHSGLVAAAAAAALLTLALLFGLLARRPSLARAARCADRWFGGQSLMTSALDQLGRAPHARAGAAGFVMEQADRSAVAWQGRVRRASPLRPSRLALPLLLAGVGAYLYLLPGADPAEAGLTAAARTEAEPTAPEPDAGEEDAGGLLAWRQAAAERDRGPASPRAAQAEIFPSPAAPGAAGEASVEALSLPADAETSARARPDPADALAEAAGSRPGSSRARPGELLEPGAPSELEVSYLEIPRAQADAGGGSSGTALEAGTPGDALRAEAVAAAAPPGPELARSALAPALRGYVTHFLNEIREHPQ